MNATAKLSDLLEPLELMPTDDYHLCYDRQTGAIVSIEKRILSAVEEGEEESLADLPDWQNRTSKLHEPSLRTIATASSLLRTRLSLTSISTWSNL